MAIQTEYSVRMNSTYPPATRRSALLPASARKVPRRRRLATVDRLITRRRPVTRTPARSLSHMSPQAHHPVGQPLVGKRAIRSRGYSTRRHGRPCRRDDVNSLGARLQNGYSGTAHRQLIMPAQRGISITHYSPLAAGHGSGLTADTLRQSARPRLPALSDYRPSPAASVPDQRGQAARGRPWTAVNGSETQTEPKARASR